MPVGAQPVKRPLVHRTKAATDSAEQYPEAVLKLRGKQAKFRHAVCTHLAHMSGLVLGERRAASNELHPFQ